MGRKGKIALIGVMLLFLGACGNTAQTTADGKMQIDYWVLFGGGDLGFMEEIVQNYNESQDEVYVNMVLQDFDEYYTKLTTSVVANRGPDVAISHATVLPELINQGLTIPLNSIADEADLDWEQYNENILEAVEVEGERYAVPLDTHTSVMYLNTELAEEAGMIDDNGELLLEEETPEAFLDFFQRPKQENMEEMPLAFSTGAIDAYRMWWAFYHQMGGRPIFDVKELNEVDVTIDKEAAVAAAEFLKRWTYEDQIVPLNLADFYQDFQNERAAGIITGVWSTGIWEEAELDFQAYPVPTLFEQEGAFGNSHTLIMPIKENTNKERQRAAMDFMEYVTTEGGLTWSEAGHIPAHNDTIESEAFQELPHRADYVEVADYVDYPPKSIYYRPAETEMIRNLDEILADRISPEQGIENMINDLEVVTK
ncbi:extracellular solute-binding protein [Salibacterium aidingense]|uniref:extracellular solute-binding protein n=1 Tax=Salibacterium aidingense TaxID=384933 RepID=UPI0003F5992C|nr:extracellular solute-binding protein [Salibacterium aidingense]